MAAAIFYQIFNCVKRKLCLSDEDYVREYFMELELAERLDLTPVMSDTIGKSSIGHPQSGVFISSQQS